jgi:hypothetical protein
MNAEMQFKLPSNRLAKVKLGKCLLNPNELEFYTTKGIMQGLPYMIKNANKSITSRS